MRRPEQALQRQVVAWLDTCCPELIAYHPANGGARSKVEAAILKGLGVKAGVADLALVLPDGRAAFIELKAAKGSPSPAQRAFAARCQAQGVPYAVCKSLPEVEGTLMAWGVTPAGRIAA